jgi:ferredoxin-NADP reductase
MGDDGAAPAVVMDHAGAREAHGFHSLPVKRIIDETDDARSFVIAVPDDLREAFRYRAGQFCTFRVRVGDDELLRSYSMSSAPETDSDLTVTVKRVPGGLVSNWFNDKVAEGDMVEGTRPAGVFCVRDGDRPVMAFCGGSGVTPVMSIAKSVLATTLRPVSLLYANRDRSSVIFRADLRSLEARYPNRFGVRHHFDSDAGFMDRQAITEFVAGRIDSDFYICGPGPFMDLVEGTLHAIGVDPDRIAIERFTSGIESPKESSVDDPSGSVSGPGATEMVTLILGGRTSTVPYRAGDTILETARRGGLQPPFSCEAGNCATCMAFLREGSATMRANNALTADEVAEGWVLTCQALPAGPSLTVEYEPL